MVTRTADNHACTLRAFNHLVALRDQSECATGCEHQITLMRLLWHEKHGTEEHPQQGMACE
jgi:hypothetical protein